MESLPKPPKTLSRASKALWKATVEEYALEPHHLRLLRLLCEALDRADAAQKVFDTDGIIVEDRFGQTKAHPCVAMKRDAEVTAARLLRELDLDASPAADSRPPHLARYR